MSSRAVAAVTALHDIAFPQAQSKPVDQVVEPNRRTMAAPPTMKYEGMDERSPHIREGRIALQARAAHGLTVALTPEQIKNMAIHRTRSISACAAAGARTFAPEMK